MANPMSKKVEANIEGVLKELEKLHENLIKANSGDNQLDYTTHPNISNKFDKIKLKVNILEKIILQKYSGKF